MRYDRNFPDSEWLVSIARNKIHPPRGTWCVPWWGVGGGERLHLYDCGARYVCGLTTNFTLRDVDQIATADDVEQFPKCPICEKDAPLLAASILRETVGPGYTRFHTPEVE